MNTRRISASLMLVLCAGLFPHNLQAQLKPPPGSVLLTSGPSPCPPTGLAPPGGWIGAGPIYQYYWFKFSLTKPATGYGQYMGPPSAQSGDATAIWHYPTGGADCLIQNWRFPNGYVGTYYHFTLGSPETLGGWESSNTGSGGSGNCDYQLVADPDATCTPTGGGGGGAGDPYTPPSNGGDPPACQDFTLPPGCYDVYIDGYYDTRVCCS
ncbi:MAG: hypothetical protein JWM95_124 [Gemmatimonadetes bacterium]|nr:hypothetical protein [Gemmatimonadota bacterium]